MMLYHSNDNLNSDSGIFWLLSKLPLSTCLILTKAVIISSNCHLYEQSAVDSLLSAESSKSTKWFICTFWFGTHWMNEPVNWSWWQLTHQRTVWRKSYIIGNCCSFVTVEQEMQHRREMQLCFPFSLKEREEQQGWFLHLTSQCPIP